ncbi:MAG: Uncharacterized protein AUREO_043780 [Aureobasidium pullulans]|nr:MAG: Uncharacterized protein AUREO_043780 [Aureobasidium pullulans]
MIASPDLVFPLLEDYMPLRFAEVKNLIDYPALAHSTKDGHRGRTIYDIPGMSDALKALEAQRKRDLEDWMTEHDFDAVVFPAVGDVGKADLEQDPTSAEHALLNGRVERPSRSPICPSQISLKVLERNVDTTESSPTIQVRGTVSPSNVALEASIDGVAVDSKFIRMDSNGHWVLEAPFSPFVTAQYTYKIHKYINILADNVMVVLLARSPDGAVSGEVVLIATETSSQPCNTP